MNDINLVILEGTVVSASAVQENMDQRHQDFVVESVRETKTGLKAYNHPCVVADKILETVGPLKEGQSVRIRGHLQSCQYIISDTSKFLYDKTRVDFIEIETYGEE